MWPRAAWQTKGAPADFSSILLASFLFVLILFPRFPGIEKTQRRAEKAKPCQNWRIRLSEQPTGKNGIDDRSDKIDVPRHLALWFQWCVGFGCHSGTPLRLIEPNYV